MSSPARAQLIAELRVEQLANQQSLLNLQQSTNQLEQSTRELHRMTSANGDALEHISDTIRFLKGDMLRNEQSNQLQFQQQSMQLQQQSMQLQQQYNHFNEAMRSMQFQLDRSRYASAMERGRFF